MCYCYWYFYYMQRVVFLWHAAQLFWKKKKKFIWGWQQTSFQSYGNTLHSNSSKQQTKAVKDLPLPYDWLSQQFAAHYF